MQVVRGHHGQVDRTRELDHPRQDPPLVGQAVVLQLDEEVPPAEDVRVGGRRLHGLRRLADEERLRDLGGAGTPRAR